MRLRPDTVASLAPFLAGALVLSGCSPPPATRPPTPPPADHPSPPENYLDGSAAGKRLSFSGFTWRLKESSQPVGPGPNRFSAAPTNAWVDADGHLHMRITRAGETWFCPELICETPATYGTYTFHLASRVDQLDPYVVLGIFTWDDTAYLTQANCEIDIEWSRWTEPNAPDLHYSVQPAHGPDEPSGRYTERYHATHMPAGKPQTTHLFTWSPGGVHFASYAGPEASGPDVIAEWSYDASAPARRTAHGHGVTQPVGVPEPGPNTHLRINLWLVKGHAPSDTQEVEVVIERVVIVPGP